LIERVYKPVSGKNIFKDLRFENYVNHFNIPIEYYNRKAFSIGGTRLYFLNDSSLIKYKCFSQNNKSGLIKLCYGDKSILFTGDLEKEGERLWTELYGKFLKTDVLKAGHHGSKSSTSELFLNYVKPTWALISVGENNKFGHPNFETIARLNKFGVGIKRTDNSGAIILSTDGNKLNFIDWK
jgi:beta-lactamase superfamily II metal-dependent hydrolase